MNDTDKDYLAGLVKRLEGCDWRAGPNPPTHPPEGCKYVKVGEIDGQPGGDVWPIVTLPAEVQTQIDALFLRIRFSDARDRHELLSLFVAMQHAGYAQGYEDALAWSQGSRCV